VKAEKKPIDELISKEPTENLFVFHFGNGDEEDQKVLLEFCQKYGPISEIPLFPGLNYGFVSFPSIAHASALINSLTCQKFVELSFYGKPRVVCFQYSSLPYSQLDKFKTMEFPNSTYECDIPGMIIIDEFLSPKEEQDIKEWLDAQNWTKLMNRRVQHFGYEFVSYGVTLDLRGK
jgi:alkylated DNA repair protein alkB homolog 8